MVDEKKDEPVEKEDNNLSIRYGKLKDKYTTLEAKLAELQEQYEDVTAGNHTLSEKNVELDKIVKTSTQELQSMKELNGVTAKAIEHGVRDFDYFTYRLSKAKTEAGVTPLDIDKFIGGLKEESSTKGMNLFGEKVVPQTTSAITKAPAQNANSTPADALKAELAEAQKAGNLGRIVTLTNKIKAKS